MIKLLLSLILFSFLKMVFISGGSFYGTAFAINHEGYYVTAYHVVKGASSLKIVLHKKIYVARVVGVDTNNDIAIVKINHTVNNPIKIDQNNRFDSNICIFGFPAYTHYGKYLHKLPGNIQSSNNRINAWFCHGNSGGPIINHYGYVEGIIVTGRWYNPTVSPLCFSFGDYVPISYVISLASRLHVPLNYGSIYKYQSFKELYNDYDTVVILYSKT